MTSSTSTPAPVSELPTLLLADDSVTIQRVIELTFANEDIRVVAVGDGDHAIATLRHSTPDIVLADIGMPGKNGYELTRHIKQTPGLEHVPVLLLTGAFEPVDDVRAREAGCDGVLVKPFEPQAIVQRVKALLAASPRPVPSAEPPAASTPPAPRPPEAGRLDEYFEQLNQAFVERASAAVPQPPARIDSGTLSAAMSTASPEAPAPTTDTPLLAGAFSALLLAEQSDAVPEPFAEWLPEEPPPASAQPPAITDETIETIVHRVLERMSDRVVRDTVASIASAVAERLVREEIERIKSHIT